MNSMSTTDVDGVLYESGLDLPRCNRRPLQPHRASARQPIHNITLIITKGIRVAFNEKAQGNINSIDRPLARDFRPAILIFQDDVSVMRLVLLYSVHAMSIETQIRIL